MHCDRLLRLFRDNFYIFSFSYASGSEDLETSLYVSSVGCLRLFFSFSPFFLCFLAMLAVACVTVLITASSRFCQCHMALTADFLAVTVRITPILRTTLVVAYGTVLMGADIRSHQCHLALAVKFSAVTVRLDRRLRLLRDDFVFSSASDVFEPGALEPPLDVSPARCLRLFFDVYLIFLLFFLQSLSSPALRFSSEPASAFFGIIPGLSQIFRPSRFLPTSSLWSYSS